MKFKGLQEAGNYKVGVGTIAGGNGLFLLEKIWTINISVN
jgi:hypothetical protein